MSSSRKTATHQQHGREELEDREPAGLEAGHASAEHRQQRRHARPEDQAPGAQQHAAALGEAPREPQAALAEDVAGARRVVVGDQDQAQRRVGAAPGRDDVLGGAAEEQGARQVEAGVQVQVDRGGGEQDQREADRRLDGGQRRCRRSRRRRAARARARTGGGRRSARCAPRGPSPAAGRRACWPPAARRRCRGRAPRSSTAPGSAPFVPPASTIARLSPDRGAIVQRAPEWRNWYTRGTQNAVSFGTCGFESHLRHRCAAASPSPTPTRGCSSSASTCARRRRSRTRSRASTSRRPIPCWPCAWTRRGRGSWGGCAGG